MTKTDNSLSFLESSYRVSAFEPTPQRAGVMGVSHDRYGVFGHSKNNDAIHGQTDSDTRAGVWGECSGNKYDWKRKFFGAEKLSCSLALMLTYTIYL
jgi:hypothetical protein